jgi:hypothetical protein
MPQQTQPAVDAIRMEPLGKFAQNGVVAGQGRCTEKISHRWNRRISQCERQLTVLARVIAYVDWFVCQELRNVSVMVSLYWWLSVVGLPDFMKTNTLLTRIILVLEQLMS